MRVSARVTTACPPRAPFLPGTIRQRTYADHDRRPANAHTVDFGYQETAAEKDFYTVINAEGEKDGKTEHLLSYIEGNAARAIRNILTAGFPLFPPQP